MRAHFKAASHSLTSTDSKRPPSSSHRARKRTVASTGPASTRTWPGGCKSNAGARTRTDSSQTCETRAGASTKMDTTAQTAAQIITNSSASSRNHYSERPCSSRPTAPSLGSTRALERSRRNTSSTTIDQAPAWATSRRRRRPASSKSMATTRARSPSRSPPSHRPECCRTTRSSRTSASATRTSGPRPHERQANPLN